MSGLRNYCTVSILNNVTASITEDSKKWRKVRMGKRGTCTLLETFDFITGLIDDVSNQELTEETQCQNGELIYSFYRIPMNEFLAYGPCHYIHIKVSPHVSI